MSNPVFSSRPLFYFQVLWYGNQQPKCHVRFIKYTIFPHTGAEIEQNAHSPELSIFSQFFPQTAPQLSVDCDRLLLVNKVFQWVGNYNYIRRTRRWILLSLVLYGKGVCLRDNRGWVSYDMQHGCGIHCRRYRTCYRYKINPKLTGNRVISHQSRCTRWLLTFWARVSCHAPIFITWVVGSRVDRGREVQSVQ